MTLALLRWLAARGDLVAGDDWGQVDDIARQWQLYQDAQRAPGVLAAALVKHPQWSEWRRTPGVRLVFSGLPKARFRVIDGGDLITDTDDVFQADGWPSQAIKALPDLNDVQTGLVLYARGVVPHCSSWLLPSVLGPKQAQVLWTINGVYQLTSGPNLGVVAAQIALAIEARRAAAAPPWQPDVD